jgi:hypothetical protein
VRHLRLNTEAANLAFLMHKKRNLTTPFLYGVTAKRFNILSFDALVAALRAYRKLLAAFGTP